MNALSAVTFHGHNLITLEHEGRPHVAMKPITEAIGLQWHAQRKRIHRHPILSEGVVMMTIPQTDESMMDAPANGGTQEAIFLPLSMLNGWLFGVDANRVKLEIRETLLTYQRECFDMLNDYWQKGATTNPRKTLTPEMQRHVQELVTGIKVQKGAHWSTTYNKIKSLFQVGSYKDVRIEDYPALCKLLGGEPLEGEWLGKAPVIDNTTNTTKVSKTNLKALVVNALSAAELLKDVYPAVRALNSPLAPEMYSRTEELRLCAQLIKKDMQAASKALR